MSFDVLKKQVQEKANFFAQEQELFRAEELNLLEKESGLALESFQKVHQTLLNNEKKSLETSVLGVAKSQSKALLHKARQEVFSSIEKQVLGSLDSLSEEEKKNLFQSFFSKSSEIISIDTLICSSSDEVLISSLSFKGVSIVVDNSIHQGLIFESSKTKQRVDLRFSTLLDSVILEYEDEILQMVGEK